MMDRDLVLRYGEGEEDPTDAHYSSLSMFYLLRSMGEFVLQHGCPSWWRPARDQLLCRRVGFVIIHRCYLYRRFATAVSLMMLFSDLQILAPVEYLSRLLHMNTLDSSSSGLVSRAIGRFSQECDLFSNEVHPHTLT